MGIDAVQGNKNTSLKFKCKGRRLLLLGAWRPHFIRDV